MICLNLKHNAHTPHMLPFESHTHYHLFFNYILFYFTKKIYIIHHSISTYSFYHSI